MIESLRVLRVSQAVFRRCSSSASFLSLLILRRISLSLGFNGFTRSGLGGFCQNSYERRIMI